MFQRMLMMKRFLSVLLIFVLLLAPVVPGSRAEEDDDGDDSGAIPLDVAEEAGAEPSVMPARDLQSGDEGDDVLFLQTRLDNLRYFSGNLDGVYGEETREAVMAFQQDMGLEPTGIADVRTQVVLSAARYRRLRYGSTGDDVRELQTRLTTLGYYKGKISGNYLEATRAAVRSFQKANGIEETGEADPETQEALYSAAAIGRGDAAEETGTPQPPLSNFLVDEEDSSAPMPEMPVAFTKKLKSGSSGSLVKQLQERLKELGYYDGPISGNYLKNTVRAVKKVQTQNGMEATGVTDEDTWNVIFNDRHIVLPEETAKPTPSPEPVPFAITVDVKNQIVHVYGRDEQGEYTIIVRQMLCSSGKVGTPSPVGDWVLNGRKSKWCYFPKWGDYARYWTRINSSVAFHSPIYRSVSNTDMKVSSYNKLGQRASHGCVRLTVEDAKWIYDNVPAGVVVTIREDLPADPELKDALLGEKAPLNTKSCTPVSTPQPTAEPEYSRDAKPDLKGGALKKGSKGASVYWLQRRLKELGYYDTKCTGKMLDRTVQAVKAFQKDHGYMQSGSVDQRLIDALAEAEKMTPEPGPVPTPAP